MKVNEKLGVAQTTEQQIVEPGGQEEVKQEPKRMQVENGEEKTEEN